MNQLKFSNTCLAFHNLPRSCMNIDRLICRFVTLALLSVSLFASAPTFAGGIVGNGTIGSCTEAALNNALATGGTVKFRCGGPSFITTTDGKIITQSTTLVAEQGPVTLYLNTAVTSVINVREEADFTAYNVNFTGGISGIAAVGAGLVKLVGSNIFNNVGAGIAMTDTDLELTNSTVSGNPGTGINRGSTSVEVSTILIQDSAIESNGEWGIFDNAIVPANWTIHRSKISQNTYTGLSLYGSIEISNSTISDNESSGLNLRGSIEISDSIIRNNTRWGLQLNIGSQNFEDTASISGSTISGNANGIEFGDTLNLVNSTVSNHNGIAVRTNGLFAAEANITSSTVVDNGGGLYHWSSENSFKVKNSLVARNTAYNCKTKRQPFVNYGNNFTDNNDDNTCTGFTVNPAVGTQLGPLADNGGPTFRYI